ncbi:globin domain-containing protein [Isoptericola sp. NPDC056578]|uniref:globin domain-containing protein n=1 Tax=Isoptericola sp. NPDC056578 TaxID=3345870 RepID=UPI00368C7346
MPSPVTLSPRSAEVVRSTLPVVEDSIDDITTIFYRTLLDEHPGLLGSMFSPERIADGSQQRALAAAITSCAAMLVADEDADPRDVLAPVARRHRAVGVEPAQYEVVHEHLFAAIIAVLGDAVTPEVAAAWDEVHRTMASTLVELEAA